MTYKDIYIAGIKSLKAAGIDNAEFDARLIFEQCFGIDRAALALSGDKRADVHAYNLFLDMIKRREEREPLQYILGNWPFMGLEFHVGPGVLIPRPETQQLAEIAVKKINEGKSVVFDLCAGSGCIGLCVAYYCKNTDVYLIEKSQQAAEYLNRNIKRLNIRNAHAMIGDIKDGYLPFNIPEPDIILCNPPYIRSDEINRLQEEVQKEPVMALNGGEDGLEFYRVLADKWLRYIKKDGSLIMECGQGQESDITDIFRGKCKNIKIFKDFNGIPRIIDCENAIKIT
ncbi:MAG: peptide chain release factor N(5)-glutamine methyltransferase [Oscillospiraceae bacterium]|jgi:release factor glutamine methyltransferase|nr:peptide chain release factor N(5)-glutamine methyltransferase [Oscillospiraceae bacterium]